MAKDHELEGQVLEIGEVQTFESGFAKQTVVVREGGSTHEEAEIPVEFTRWKDRDAIRLLGGVRIGHTVRIWFRLCGSEYQGKRYLRLRATDCRIVGGADAGTGGMQAQQPQQPAAAPAPADPLPF